MRTSYTSAWVYTLRMVPDMPARRGLRRLQIVGAIIGTLLGCTSASGSPGATSLHVRDDRPDLQRVINEAAKSGREVTLEARTYTLSPSPDGFFSLDIPANTHLRGAGPGKTILQLTPHAGASVRLLHASGSNIIIENLTLDGNKSQQTKDAQRHGVFAEKTTNLSIHDVVAQNFSGDGIYLFDGVKDTKVTDVSALANDRNGLTLGANVDGTTLLRDRFIGNKAQQVDSEPGGTGVVSHTVVRECVLDGDGRSNDYVLTISGTGEAQGHDWTVVDNTIKGAIFVVWAKHVVIEENRISNATPKSAISIYRTSENISVTTNRIQQTQRKAKALAAVSVIGTGVGQAPSHISISANDLTITYEDAYGVLAEGAVDVEITHNHLQGAGRPSALFAGIYLRATSAQEAFREAKITGNTIKDFGDRGISIHGNGDAKLLSVEIADNQFQNDSGQAPMRTAISLDDGNGAAVSVSLHRNVMTKGVSNAVINRPVKSSIVEDRTPAKAP